MLMAAREHNSRNGERPPKGGRSFSPPPAAAPGMAESVTRHAQITGPTDWKYVVCGVDTLDLGIYVHWPKWKDLFDRLEVQRITAQQR
jgi:hypothetical protein